MIHSETRRQYYLASVGVRLWYAKKPLPGAAPSPGYNFEDPGAFKPPEFPVQSEPDVRPVVVKPSSVRPVRQRSVDLQALMTPSVKENEVVPAQPISDNARVEIATDTRFEPARGMGQESVGPSTQLPQDGGPQSVISANLAIWSSERFLLISEWSTQASERLQDRLSGNLLAALHQTGGGKRQIFQWPVFRNRNIPGNSAADFRDALSRLVSSEENKSILLLGVLSSYTQEQRQHCLGSVLSSAAVDFSYSLAELSSGAGLKRDLWSVLKDRYLV